MKLDSFNLKLFNQICKSSSESENVFFSPMSISLALTMLLLGSSGKTKQQIEQALGVVKNKKLVKDVEDLNDLLNIETNGLIIHIANQIFPSESFQIVECYRKDLENSFNCQLEKLDYTNVDESKNIINKWVENSTDGKIKNLFDSMEPDIACVLVSCIYFKGDWLDKFMSQKTRDRLFYCPNKETCTVKMMHKDKCMPYLYDKQNKFKCVKLRYKEDEFSMVLILPDEKYGVDDVINRLDVKTIDKLENDDNFDWQRVWLEIPKFKIEYATSLIETLKTLGIEDAFDEKKAKFNNMSTEKIYVSEVIHKAFIETSEDGTEAAAATGIKLCTRRPLTARRINREYFVADHPFVFMIKQGCNILFMGKIISIDV